MATYKPKFQKQLDGSATASSDCGPRSASMGIDWQTEGSKVPTVADFRRRAGTVGDVPNTTATLERGIESYDTPKETQGWGPLKADRHTQESMAVLEEGLQAGRFAILSIDYGTVNARRPDLSSDPKFFGGHSVGVYGRRELVSGKVEWQVWDPLADGRRDGIPKGPTWWPRALAKAAAEDFAKKEDHFTGLILRKPKPVEVPEPEPTPPPKPPTPSPEEIIEKLEARIEELEARNAGLKDRLHIMEERIAGAVSLLQGTVAADVPASIQPPVDTGQVELG